MCVCERTADAWTVPVTFIEGVGLTDAVQHVFKDPLHPPPPASILGSKGHVRSFCKGGGVFISAVKRAGMTMVFYVTAEF